MDAGLLVSCHDDDDDDDFRTGSAGYMVQDQFLQETYDLFFFFFSVPGSWSHCPHTLAFSLTHFEEEMLQSGGDVSESTGTSW